MECLESGSRSHTDRQCRRVSNSSFERRSIQCLGDDYRHVLWPSFSTTNFVRVATGSNISVSNQAAFIDADNQSGLEGSSVTVTAQVTDTGASDTHSFLIEWPDNTTSSGAVVAGMVSASKTFVQDGTYLAKLTVTDNGGAFRTKDILIQIGNVAPAAGNNSGFTTNEDSSLTIIRRCFWPTT